MNQPAFLSGRYDIVDEELTLFARSPAASRPS